MFPISISRCRLNIACVGRNILHCITKTSTSWALLCLMVVGVVTCSLSAQTPEEQKNYEQQQLQRVTSSKDDWKKLIEGTNFSETPEKKTEQAKPLNRPNFTPPSPPSKVLMTILYIVAAVILIIFLAYIITGGFKNISPSNNTKIKVTEENIEENLMDANPDDFLPPAIQRNDYRQAIRLRYLSIIKRLAETDRIRWRKEKTNNNYIAEMANSPLCEEFMKVTRIYERIWFGDWTEPYAEHDFELHGTSFDELLRGIG